MREIKCLLVMPLQTPKVTKLEVSMNAFRKAVSIGVDEELRVSAKKIGDSVYILYAADAMLAGLPANRKIGGEIISGNFYVVAVDEDRQPVSLTEKQMMKYMMRFYEAEHYSEREIVSNWSDHMLKLIDSMDV